MSDKDWNPPAAPSLRVHRVFHRAGVVVGGFFLAICIVFIFVALANIVTGNPQGTLMAASTATSLFLVAVAFYVLFRAIGWIVAGAMRY